MNNIGVFEGFFSHFSRWNRRGADPAIIKELDLLFETYTDAMLRERSINIGIGMISRSIEMVEWKTEEKHQYKPDSLYYHLNVKPNKNQSASEFWSSLIYKLLYSDGEVLVIKSDDDQLLIADDFHKEEYALYDNVFSGVKIGNFEFERHFSADQVLYIENRNKQLKKYVAQLDESYGKLFDRMLATAMRTNQIRGKVKIDGVMNKRKDAVEVIQAYIDKIYKAYTHNSVAIVAEVEGTEYTENTNSSRNVSSIDEVATISNHYLDSVLGALGIHPSLVYGESAKSNIQFYQNNFLLNVINPLAKSIEREINAKFFTEAEHLAGSKVIANTLKLEYTNIFSLAAAMEKAVGAQSMTPNEIREYAGLERVEAEGMDEFYITKNIEKGADGNKQEVVSDEKRTSDSSQN